MFLKFSQINRETPVLESFFNKAAGSKEIRTQVSSNEYCKVFKNNFLYRIPPVATSDGVCLLKSCGSKPLLKTSQPAFTCLKSTKGQCVKSVHS